MRVKAKHWVTYGGVWHKAGEEFYIEDADKEQMLQYADPVDEPSQPGQEEKPSEAKAEAEAPKRGRKRRE